MPPRSSTASPSLPKPLAILMVMGMSRHRVANKARRTITEGAAAINSQRRTRDRIWSSAQPLVLFRSRGVRRAFRLAAPTVC